MVLLPLSLLLAASSGPIASWDATLQLHKPGTTAKFNAKCLDGSSGGFYYRPASSTAAANKWKFHFMGGGWCNDETSCASRSKGLLGSSKPWPPALSNLWGSSAGFYGLMNANDTSVNPFGDWNFVWLAYCDGTSQTSDRDQPLNGLYYRGRALLDAHLHDLEADYQFLSTATEVIISGTSAGGMSTYVQSSFIKSQLKAPGARLVAVPDAGWWWDHKAFSGKPSPWVTGIAKSIGSNLWNATLRGSGTKCIADAKSDFSLLTHCYTQPYAYAYLAEVPTFVVQSFADPANLGFCFSMPCGLKGNTNGTCTPAETSAIGAYGQELKQSILTAQKQFGTRDGHFLTSCNQHEESCREKDWFGIRINGQTMNSTFYNWYQADGAAQGATAVDGAWPSDSSCWVGRHGSC